MDPSRLISWVSLALAMTAFVLALAAWETGKRALKSSGIDPDANSSGTEWLTGATGERFQEVERQLRGLDVAMVETGYRFSALYFAGSEGNWEHAKYQVDKIETALRLALVRRPKRGASAEPFLNEDLLPVKEVIEQRDAGAFMPAMERLRTACMKCHVAEQVPYFTVELPENRLSTIRSAP
jgi:hypothetical protein